MAILYALLGMLCWGMAPLFGKLGLYNVNPMTALCLRTMIAASLVLGWLIGTRGFHQMLQIPPKFWIYIGIEAILATLVGDLFYFAALKLGNINQVTLILSSSPLVTMLFAFLFFHEIITGHQLIGAMCIVVGLIFISIP